MEFTNLTIHYMGNDPHGVRVCRVEGSVMEAIVVPRESLAQAKALADEMPKHGVYFLVEDGAEVELPKIYAGQTQKGMSRLYDHKASKKKEYWTLAVMFVAKENHFTLDVISALEKLAIDSIMESARYNCDNKVDPKYNINMFMKSTVDDYFSSIKFVMESLGWGIDKKVMTGKGEWYTKRNGIVAYGHYSEGRVDVLPGSQVAFNKPVNLSSYNVLRESLYKSGDIVETKKGVYVLNKMLSFKTPSGASDFVLGGSTNGWVEWVNAKGEKLDIMRKK